MGSSKLSKNNKGLIKIPSSGGDGKRRRSFSNVHRKKAKKHLMFEWRNEEGLFQSLIANYLREDHNKFVDFFLLTAEQLAGPQLAVDGEGVAPHPESPTPGDLPVGGCVVSARE